MENKNDTAFERSVEELSKEQLSGGKNGETDAKKKTASQPWVKIALVLVCAAVFIVSGVILVTQIKDQRSTNRQKDDAAKIYNDMAKQMDLYGAGDRKESEASIFDASNGYIASGDTPSERITGTESAGCETDATDAATESSAETTGETETSPATESSAESESESADTASETETDATESTTEWTPGPVINDYLMPDTPAGTWLTSMPIPSAALVRDANASVFVNSSKMALLALRQKYKNSDIVAYLSMGKIGSTGRIEDSVVEGAVTIYGDNDLYLDHDLYKMSNANGALFIDCSCDVNLLNNHNTIIYGHHLSTGSTKAIFGHLDYYRNLDYLMENQDVTLQMGDAVYYYKVVLCATVDYDTEMVAKYSYSPMLLYNTRYSSTERFFSAYRKITSDFARLGKIRVIRYDGWTTALDPDGPGSDVLSSLREGDRFLTLSTCYGELGTSSRCIVICKLTKVLLPANQ